jgi:hypothetical protein
VHHDVLSGLKYLQVVKRRGIRVSKDEEMLVRHRVSCYWRRWYANSPLGKLRS